MPLWGILLAALLSSDTWHDARYVGAPAVAARRVVLRETIYDALGLLVHAPLLMRIPQVADLDVGGDVRIELCHFFFGLFNYYTVLICSEEDARCIETDTDEADCEKNERQLLTVLKAYILQINDRFHAIIHREIWCLIIRVNDEPYCLLNAQIDYLAQAQLLQF